MWSGVAFQPDTTNHSPNVPAPHNSPVWNSTNPISATAVSTGRPHSWAYHWPKIRPFWLLCCMPVITHKKMLIPTDSPPHGLMAPLLCPHALAFRRSPNFKFDDRGQSVTSAKDCCQVCHIKSTALRLHEKIQIWWDLRAVSQIDWDFMSSQALLWFDV